MASARRPRTSSRPSVKSVEGSTDRDDDGGEKSKQRKRKLSDMLGPPWSKEDLELFYQAFRKYGRDWKKVAGSVHKRTVEMVEALYHMNRAFLSLPEGTASAAGLIAMMTDHYNILEESQSVDEDSSDEFGSDERVHQAQQTSLRKRVGSLIMGTSSDGPVETASGGPSPAKKPRTNRPRVVGKRTPRFPPGSVAEKKLRNNKVSLMKLPQQLEEDSESDAAEVMAARTLLKNKTASPSVSYTPSRRSLRQANANQNGDIKQDTTLRVDPDALVRPTAPTTQVDGSLERSEESKDLEFEGATRVSSTMQGDRRAGGDAKKVPVGDAKSRLKKPLSKKPKLQNLDKVDGARGLYNSKDRKEIEDEGFHDHNNGADDPTKGSKEVAPGQRRRRPISISERPKKRSRKLFSGDNNSGLDALATLADMSLNGLLPSPRTELGTPLTLFADAAEQEASRLEADKKLQKQTSPKRRESKRDVKVQQAEVKVELENGNVEGEGKEMVTKEDGGGTVLLAGQPSTSPSEVRKRKRKLPSEKVSKVKPPAAEGDATVVLKARTKLKRATGTKNLSVKLGLKTTKQQTEMTGEDGHLTSPGKECADGGGNQAMEVDEGTLPLKLRSKKKAPPEKYSAERGANANLSGSLGVAARKQSLKEPPHCPHTTPDLGPRNARANLIHCLSPKVRRWCMYEWFYSAIDLPWFFQNEFVEYLNHAGLGHVPRLTRVEWGVIRGSLGKPRRLSKQFLQVEREKLETYRDSVRTHYHELRTGLREGLPADLARPLTVGQRVIGRHPRTREIHDGSILTVDRNRCRVQFDRPELGVELVLDIDAMPIHPLDNMPEVMRLRRILVDRNDRLLGEDPKSELKLRAPMSAGGAARAALNERLERPSRHYPPFSQLFLNDLSKRAQDDSIDAVRLAKAATLEATAATQKAILSQPYGMGHSQAREADVRALADVTRALEKKIALVMELRQMNDEVEVDTEGVKDSEAFQRQYATVVLQIKEVNSQVSNALVQLRQRNKYQDNAVPPWHRSPQGVFTGVTSELADSGGFGLLDQGLALGEITLSAKKHAELMVSTAVKAMDAVKEGDDALHKLGSALEALAKGGGPSLLPQQHTPSVATSAETAAPLGLAGSLGQPSTAPVPDGIADPENRTAVSSVRATRPHLDSVPESRSTTLEVAAHNLVQQLSQAGCLTDANKEGTFLSELMTSCVATLFLLQTLSDRTFSTSDVNQTLDSVLVNLRPRSAQNHCIYKEIEQQLGMVKSQITALIPVPSNILFGVDIPIAQTHTT